MARNFSHTRLATKQEFLESDRCSGSVFEALEPGESIQDYRGVANWQETFATKEAALKRAAEIIRNDEERLRSLHNYQKPEDLVEEAWDSLNEMYQVFPD